MKLNIWGGKVKVENFQMVEDLLSDHKALIMDFDV
jgi:hypothetical protein